MTFETDLERLVVREVRGTAAAATLAGGGTTSILAIAASAYLVALDTALRAAVMEPALAEKLRDQVGEAIHRAPDADPVGEHHANAAADRLLDLVR